MSKFSTERMRNIFPFVIPTSWNKPISLLRRLMKILLAYSRKIETIATRSTDAARMAAAPLIDSLLFHPLTDHIAM